MSKKTKPEPEAPPEDIGQPSTQEIPHNREAEEAVLGSVLIDPDCYLRLAAILKPTDFYIVRHKWIWQALGFLTERGSPLDYLTISEELKRLGRLKELGGVSYLTALLNQFPTSLHAEAYAQLVKDQAERRASLNYATELATLAYNQKITPEQIAGRLAEMAQAATGTTQRRYVVRDAAYALEPRPPVKYLVDGLIYEKSITVLYGDGGTKKTWSSMYLAACVASGAAWGDLKTQKTPVLFVDEENGESEIATRAAFCIRGALPDEGTDLKYISLAAFHLDKPQDEATLTNEILEQGAGLVVFDALADLMVGDENSKQDTQPVFNALRRITEKTGAAILVIHHANKQNGFRGSSVIKDAPDILIKVESDEDSHFVNFKTEKNRKGKSIKWAMFATWTDDQFSLGHREAQETAKHLGKAEEFVIRYLTEHGASGKETIEGAADTCSPNGARQAIYSLAKSETIRRTNPSASRKIQAIYELTSTSIVCQDEADNNNFPP